MIVLNAALLVNIVGIRELVAGSLLYGNKIISGAVMPNSNAIEVHCQSYLEIYHNRRVVIQQG